MANKKVKKEEKRDISSEINIDEIKSEIVDYARKSVDNKIDELVRKTDKRIISIKNRSIFKRNIVILVLLCLCGFLTYSLYEEGYFDKYFNKKGNTVLVEEPKEEEPKEEPKETEETKLDKLKKEYANLLDNIIILKK